VADRSRQQDARQRRLAAALRDNLKRRKAQARGRKDGRPDAETTGNGRGKPHDSAGFVGDK